MNEISESLLKELTNGLRYDIDKELDKLFGLRSFDENGYRTKSLRFKFIVNVKGARLDFVIWLNFEPNKRQEVFDYIKKYLNEQYGLKLVNQRLYTYQNTLEFGEIEELVDPMETYTLLKIKQVL